MPKVIIEKNIIPFKTISQVANSIGVETHVLRFWEKEFAQIKPQRSNTRRYYTKDDIDLISRIKSLLHEQGFTIEGAKKHLKSQRSFDGSNILQELYKIEKILL